jgi:hypothetical protein
MLLTSVGSPDPPAHPSDSIGAEDDHAAARRVVEAALDTRSSARPCHVPTVDRDRIWQARLKVVTSWSVRRLQLRFCRACNGGSVGVPWIPGTQQQRPAIHSWTSSAIRIGTMRTCCRSTRFFD